MTASLLALVLLTQCPPGVSCPTPTPAWNWYQIHDGAATRTVWGYPDGTGIVRYDPALPANTRPTVLTPPPTPAPVVPAARPVDPPAPEAEPPDDFPENFGVDLAGLNASSVESVTTNDPDLGTLVPELGAVPSEAGGLFKPRVEVRVNLGPYVLPALLLVAAGLIAVVARRNP
jgi:hypothetical protein